MTNKLRDLISNNPSLKLRKEIKKLRIKLKN